MTTSFRARGQEVSLTLFPPRYAGEPWRARARSTGMRKIVVRGRDAEVVIERAACLARQQIGLVRPSRRTKEQPQLLWDLYARQCVSEALARPPYAHLPSWLLAIARIVYDAKSPRLDFIVVTLNGPIGITVGRELIQGPSVQWCAWTLLPIIRVVVEDDCDSARLSRHLYELLAHLQARL